MNRTELALDFFELLAVCLEYPTPETRMAAFRLSELSMLEGESQANLSEAADAYGRFLDDSELNDSRERYTRLFDMSPVCSLHVGYHIFGEQYARGELLAGLVMERRNAGLPESEDLPDYLPDVLRLFARLSPEDRETLAGHLLIPALVLMRQELTDVSSPWTDLLRALPEFLGTLVGVQVPDKVVVPSQRNLPPEFPGKKGDPIGASIPGPHGGGLPSACKSSCASTCPPTFTQPMASESREGTDHA